MTRAIRPGIRSEIRTGIRLPISFSLALLTTAVLFWFLGLVTAGAPVGPPTRIIPHIEFITHIPEPVETTRSRVKPVIPKPEPLPDRPTVIDTSTDNVKRDIIDPSILRPTDWGPGGGEGGLPGGGDRDLPLTGGSDRVAMPQVRIEPDYPLQAKERGIEGWIQFRFTVTEGGSVKDIVIVAADPPHIWDSATRRAVASWKYQPKIVDGKPVEQRGVTVTYRFELAQ